MAFPSEIRSAAENMLRTGISVVDTAKAISNQYGIDVTQQNVRYWHGRLKRQQKGYVQSAVAAEVKDIEERSEEIASKGWTRMNLLDADEKAIKSSGVYLIQDGDGNIIYVGSSKSVRERFSNGHHVLLPALRAGGCILFCKPANDYAELESRLICYFKSKNEPLLNAKI